MVGRLCLSQLLLALLLSSFGLAETTSRYVVTFANITYTAEPSVVDGQLVVFLESGAEAVSGLSSVVHIESLYRRGEPTFSMRGPWVLWVAASAGVTASASQIEQSYLVDSVLDASIDPEDAAIGESSVMQVPPHGTPDQNTYFCDNSLSPQRHLYYRLDNEQAGDEDWCANSKDYSEHDSDMDCIQAWGVTKGDSNVVVAVADFGIDWTHPALGGPGPAIAGALLDSLASYNSGVIFRNWREYPGDWNQDGRPGIAGVDDDGDGRIDEDSMGREPGNIAENDVFFGYITYANKDTIVDLNANFGDLVSDALYIYGDISGHNQLYKKIIFNTATMIVTKPLSWVDYPNGWADVAGPGDMYQVSNRIDDDDDGEIDDTGYLNDLVGDDDENSFVDDLRGWDFVDIEDDFNPYDYYALGDYWGQDNDARDLGNHGTEVASQISSSWEYGRIVGVAPDAKILPIRIGYFKKPYPPSTKYREVLDVVALQRALDYVKIMGPKILVTALASPFSTTAAFADLINNYDVVHVNGSGNFSSTYNTWHALSAPNVLVAGLTAEDGAWVDTNYGEWVDVAARAGSVVAAAPNHLTAGTFHGYNWVSGTSLSGPIVGGVAALIKSVHPDWGRDEIIKKLLVSVDNIYMPPEAPLLNAAFAQGSLLGSGRVNAYKAVTMYGTVGSVSQDTTWSGVVYVSGDIYIPEGAHLTVAPGTVVRVAIDDILGSSVGVVDNIQFVVAGKLTCNGSDGAPVIFELFSEPGDTVSSWGPIVLSGGVNGSEARLSYTELWDLSGGIIKEAPAENTRARLFMEHCQLHCRDGRGGIGDEAGGPQMYRVASGDSVRITETQIVGPNRGTGVGLYVEVASPDDSVSVCIQGGIEIVGFAVGVTVVGGAQTLAGVHVDSCGIGISIVGSVLGPQIGPDVVITSATDIGILHDGGTAEYSGVLIENSGQSGLQVQGVGKPVFGAAGVVVETCGLHGLYLDNASNETKIQNVAIVGATNSGIRITDCSVDVDSTVSVLGPGSAGVFLVGSGSVIDGVNIAGVASGIRVFEGSTPIVRRCIVSNCTYGVFVNFDAFGDFGTAAEYGSNRLSAMTKYAVNWNDVYTLPFQYNCFDGVVTPPASMFGTKTTPYGIFNGPIAYTPGYCQ